MQCTEQASANSPMIDTKALLQDNALSSPQLSRFTYPWVDTVYQTGSPTDNFFEEPGEHCKFLNQLHSVPTATH